MAPRRVRTADAAMLLVPAQFRGPTTDDAARSRTGHTATAARMFCQRGCGVVVGGQNMGRVYELAEIKGKSCSGRCFELFGTGTALSSTAIPPTPGFSADAAEHDRSNSCTRAIGCAHRTRVCGMDARRPTVGAGVRFGIAVARPPILGGTIRSSVNARLESAMRDFVQQGFLARHFGAAVR